MGTIHARLTAKTRIGQRIFGFAFFRFLNVLAQPLPELKEMGDTFGLEKGNWLYHNKVGGVRL